MTYYKICIPVRLNLVVDYVVLWCRFVAYKVHFVGLEHLEALRKSIPVTFKTSEDTEGGLETSSVWYRGLTKADAGRSLKIRN